MIFPDQRRDQHIWQMPTSQLWDILLGAVVVDTDDTVERARNNLRLRGELDGLN